LPGFRQVEKEEVGRTGKRAQFCTKTISRYLEKEEAGFARSIGAPVSGEPSEIGLGLGSPEKFTILRASFLGAAVRN
jgi:hypothetical protein